MSVYHTSQNCKKTIQCAELRKGEICFGDLVITKPEPKTFKVVCVGHKTSEDLFTIGKIYIWDNGNLKADNGFIYPDTMVGGSDPDKWHLADWYKFIKIVP